jgi:hypothetical protein
MSALRLFAPADSATDKSVRRTLRDCYLAFTRPRLVRRGRAARTLDGYLAALSRWERLSGDPSVTQITDRTLDEFADALLEEHRMKGQDGHHSTRKHAVCVQAILADCGRPHDGAPPLLSGVPRCDLPAPPAGSGAALDKRRRIATAELAGCYAECGAAAWPTHLSARASDVWRALLVLAATYGPRTQELIGLEWGNVSFDERCPHPKYSTSIVNPHGWLWHVPRKTRATKPEPLYLPLTIAARAHLERLRRTGAGGRIFALPRSRRAFDGQRRRLWRLAVGRGAEWTPYTWHELRFTASCAWNDLRPGLGEHVTGHAPRGVNRQSYDEDLHRLVTFAPLLDLPAEFARPPGPRQLLLF